MALAVGSWDVVEAVLLADPAASRTRHEIVAIGPAGEYCFEIRNRPSPQTPTTSGVVPYAVLRTIAEIVRPGFIFR